MSAEELFDIVDENNEPLGFTKSREEVHTAMRHWHRTTHIWIINASGLVLCQQRSFAKDANPGKWQSFFGGHLKAGQTYIDNAVEELFEELGLSVMPDELIPVHVLKSDSAKHFCQVFVLWWNGNVESVHYRDDEVASVRWMTLGEVKDQIKKGLFCNDVDSEVEYLLLQHSHHEH
ncbi:MAG: NUDIX domain-containing protein [Candidatus Liptonbacteria bacterium]|nr:NUDIX domain-containing protein [Candidatus Liptonbacteria bacterium]